MWDTPGLAAACYTDDFYLASVTYGPERRLMEFTIGRTEIRKRNRNVVGGLVFGSMLAALIVVQNQRSPDVYNTTLLWSVVGFVVIANVVNLVRHLRYVRLTKSHRLEVLDDSIRFVTGNEMTELQLEDVAAIRLFHRRKELLHIQVLLKNKRGIRLEGYDDLEGLSRLLQNRVPDSTIT